MSVRLQPSTCRGGRNHTAHMRPFIKYPEYIFSLNLELAHYKAHRQMIDILLIVTGGRKVRTKKARKQREPGCVPCFSTAKRLSSF